MYADEGGVMSNLSSRLRQLPFAAALLAIGTLTVCGTVYLVTYQNKLGYLTSRDLRLLALLGSQTEDQLSDTATKAGRGGNKVVLRWVNADGPAIAFQDSAHPLSRLDGVIAGLFRSKIEQGVFDTLAFATPEGQVAFATGARERELQGMDLAALLPEAAGASTAGQPPVSFADRFSHKVTVQDAAIGGIAYRMFIQPCCRLVKAGTETWDGHATGPSGGAIVVGLVPAETLRSEAMAVSPTLVIIAAVLVVLAMLAWPFLNIFLQGPRQRITQWDALQLGFSGMLGLAVITIVTITSVQCARLERDIDEQLESFATRLDHQLRDEIAARFAQLEAIQPILANCAAPDGATVAMGDCKLSADSTSGSQRPSAVDYNSAFLVRKDGRQVRKAWLKNEPPPLFDVKDRGYFRHFTEAASKETARRESDCQDQPCMLESLVSWTTGDRSAVLARPTGDDELPVAGIGFALQPLLKAAIPPGFEFAIIDRAGNVVFHSDVERNNHENLFVETDQDRELRSLVGSGIDGDLRVDYWGRPYQAYVKHASAFRWSVVTLFDRRSIRGLMVEWTVVSLFLLLAYTMLWLVAMYFVVTQRSGWILPERLRPWIWPDRLRKRRYQLLTRGYLALLAVFAFVMLRPDLLVGFGLVEESHDAAAVVGLAGFVIPLLACAVTFLVLRAQPAAMAGTPRHEPKVEYCVAVALLLTIIGIVPGLAFVARSYDSHMEAYLKFRQMGIAQAVNARIAPDRLPVCPQNPDDQSVGELYGTFLYDTSVCLEQSAQPACDPLQPHEVHAESSGRDPLNMLESLLPYYSEESVKLRELLHHHADDCSWITDRRGGHLSLKVRSQSTDRPVLVVKTEMPALTLNPFRAAPATGTLQMAVIPAGGMVILAVLAALAYGVARFMRDYVFLGEVASPPWALGRMAITEGDTVILVCDPSAMAPRIDGALELRVGPLVARALTALPPRLDDAAKAKLEGELANALRRIGEHPRHRPLLVPDLDANGAGLSTLAAKAWLLNSLVEKRTDSVIALLRRPLPQFAAALQGVWPDVAAKVDELAQRNGVSLLDWRAKSGPADGPLTVSTVPAVPVWSRRSWSPRRAQIPRVLRAAGLSPAEALLCSEERAYPPLRTIGTEIRQLEAFRADRLGPAEVLEEIDERAESLYEDVWDRCSDNEKLALRHIAQFGLANSGNRLAVRRLVARRLVIKDPDLRLMNRSFDRFVLCRDHAASVDIARIEKEIPQSAWDRLRTPLILVSVGVGVFLFTTQRDMFNTTVGALVGISTAAPSLLKLFALVARKDIPGSGQAG
jgi:hypothetical protein